MSLFQMLFGTQSMNSEWIHTITNSLEGRRNYVIDEGAPWGDDEQVGQDNYKNWIMKVKSDLVTRAFQDQVWTE